MCNDTRELGSYFTRPPPKKSGKNKSFIDFRNASDALRKF